MHEVSHKMFLENLFRRFTDSFRYQQTDCAEVEVLGLFLLKTVIP